jgi:uncharacterized small protein (DUF1192 family)
MVSDAKPMGVVEMCETLRALAQPELAERVASLGRELRHLRSEHEDTSDLLDEAMALLRRFNIWCAHGGDVKTLGRDVAEYLCDDTPARPTELPR